MDSLTTQIIHDLQEQKGYSETEAYSLLYSGGLTIHATQKPAVQEIVDREINNVENYPSAPETSFTFRLTIQKPDGSFQNYSEQTMLSYYQAANGDYDITYPDQESAAAAIEEYKSEIMEEGDIIPENGESIFYTLQPQASMTVIDHSTGAVLAICGGRGEKVGTLTLNRATGTTRQAGSTFKIMAAYAPALQVGGLTLASVQDDAPMDYANGTPLHNYDNKYRGFTTIREAITWSINVVAVKTLTQISTGVGYEFVQDLGITTLESGDNNQALALSGITRGVSNIELCGAYATIANHGKYNKPYLYTQVLDHRGNVILDNTDNTPREVLSNANAFLLTDAMKDVVTKGTGTRANPGNIPVAGKTGTTTKDRDVAFAGYSPYYTAAIWGGYDDNHPQKNTSYANNIWREVMKALHADLEQKDFEVPEDVVKVSVCKKSGKKPLNGICDHDPRGSQVYSEYFAVGTEPTETCDHHARVRVCKDSGLRAGEFCPNVSNAVYIVGGSGNTQDGQYLLRGGISKICTIHTAENQGSAEETPEGGEATGDSASGGTGDGSAAGGDGSGNAGGTGDGASGEPTPAPTPTPTPAPAPEPTPAPTE